MTGKQLRNSILQWAIQGKLVPQDPNDEPASVLLERIRAEKARLIKEKKIKRDKNETVIYRGEDNSYYEKTFATGAVRCIDDEIPFDIPQGWEWERWGNISFSIQYGYNAPANENGDVRMVRISDIQDNKVRWDQVPFCKIAANEISNYILETNDILFARTGGTVGKSFLVECVPVEAIYAGYLIRTRYSNELSSIYLKSFMESSLYWEQLKSGTIATAQPNCNGKTLGKMFIPIPPKAEQKRIVAKIAELKALIENYGVIELSLRDLNNSIKEKLKNSILQDAIQGRIVPQIESEGTAEDLLKEIRIEKKRLVKEGKLKKSAIANESRIFRDDDNKYYEQIGSTTKEISEEIPFDIPVSWQWCRMDAIFQINPKNEAEDDSEAAFVPMEAIKPGYGSGFTFQLTKWKSIKRGYTHFADGDIAFAKITPCFQNRKSVIFHNLPSGIGAGTTELKVLRPLVNQISPEYILAFLQSPYFIDEATFKGTANQQRIISGYVENKFFPLPPFGEQRRIAHRLQKLLELTR